MELPLHNSLYYHFQVNVKQKVVQNLENPVSFHLTTTELHILNVRELIGINHGALQRLIVVKIT